MSDAARARLAELILYVGRRPLRSGRVALACVAWLADFEAYRDLGRPLTGPTPADAALEGWRWGRVEHALREGRLTRRDAEWVAWQWRDGVPV